MNPGTFRNYVYISVGGLATDYKIHYNEFKFWWDIYQSVRDEISDKNPKHYVWWGNAPTLPDAMNKVALTF